MEGWVGRCAGALENGVSKEISPDGDTNRHKWPVRRVAVGSFEKKSLVFQATSWSAIALVSSIPFLVGLDNLPHDLPQNGASATGSRGWVGLLGVACGLFAGPELARHPA